MFRLCNSIARKMVNIDSTRVKAQLIDGVNLAAEIKLEVKVAVEAWIAAGNKRPYLVTVVVGENPASQTYVSHKLKAADFVGIQSRKLQLDENISERQLSDVVTKLNTDPEVDGILVQLPLPNHLPERKICNLIVSNKDVDGFHIENIGKLTLNMNTIVPCTPLAVFEILKRMKIDTFGKHVVVCGRSKNVGLPISLLLHSDGRQKEEDSFGGLEATTTICHRNTPRELLKQLARTADVIISATGVPNLITADIVKEGACVIDVGITRIKLPSGKTKLVGDVDFENVSKVAGYITPVPGGVGPLTVAMLMKNTLKAAELNALRQK